MSTPPTPENVAAVDFIAQAQGALANASELPLGDSGESYYVGTAQVHATLAVAERLGKIADLLRPPRTVGDAVRAVVVEGEETPLVLEWPAELGMSWPDGGDLLALASGGIAFYPRGLDEWVMDPAEARQMAAQLAAMAAACEAANGGEGHAAAGQQFTGRPATNLIAAMSAAYAGPEQAERISAALTGQDLKDGAR